MSSNNPSSDAATSPILTKLEAAAFLRCSPRYVERQVKLGRIKAYKPSGRLWRIRRTELEAFLESGATTKRSRLTAPPKKSAGFAGPPTSSLPLSAVSEFNY